MRAAKRMNAVAIECPRPGEECKAATDGPARGIRVGIIARNTGEQA